jgi:hypothetical protein
LQAGKIMMMQSTPLISLLIFYGLFLIICGISALVFIGAKAKTAVMSGGISGATAIGIAYAATQGFAYARYFGLVLCLLLFAVFSWRASKTLIVLLKLSAEKLPEVKEKAVAFLIIALMAVVTLFVFALLLVL